MSGSATDPGAWLGPGFQTAGPRCLIDASVFPPRNIRTSLALFQQVALVAPLRDHHDNALKGLAIKEDDLVQLAHRGRIRVLFPQAINRYSPTFIEKLCELDGTPFVLSRRLAAATVVDSRRRMPLLHPPVGIAGRRALLVGLQTMEDASPAPWRQALIQGLGESWLSTEHALNFSGAMANAQIGIGRILGEMVKRQTGRDLLLELLFTSTHVSWAGALGASIMPPNIEGQDGEQFQRMTEFCASSYSGAAPNASLMSIGNVDPLVEGLLALEGDISVLELDDAFSPQDVVQLNDLILGLAKANPTPKDIRKIVRDMNDKIRTFQKRTRTLDSLNLLAPAGAVASYALGSNPAGAAIVGLGSWLLALIFKDLDPGKIPGGEMLDWVRGVNALTTPDVVLVSRLRKTLTDT